MGSQVEGTIPTSGVFFQFYFFPPENGPTVREEASRRPPATAPAQSPPTFGLPWCNVCALALLLLCHSAANCTPIWKLKLRLWAQSEGRREGALLRNK